MKDTYYFSHDYNPTSDPKMQALIGEHGAVGYGLYWRIVEMLHEEGTHKLPCKKYIYLALSKQMSLDVDTVELVINCCIELCELFNSDGIMFWSERVLRNIGKRNEISTKRSEAGKRSAELRKSLASDEQNSTNVEQVSTSVQQNPTKERKVKENKVNENKEKKEIKEEDINIVSGETKIKNESFEKFNKWVDENATNVRRIKNQITEEQFMKLKEKYNSQQIMQIILNLENYKDAPKKYTSVYLTVNNWIKNESSNKSYGERNTKVPASGSREAKEQSRRNLVKLADQILGIDESEDNGRSFR